MTSADGSGPPGAVWDGLRRLAALPAWLEDGVRPDRVGAALADTVPEFADGTITLAACRVRQPRLDGDHWTARYQLTVREPGRPCRLVALVGELYPPGAPPPGGQPCGRFGSGGWRGWLPALRLALQPEPADAGLPALRILTDPAQARGVLERTIRASTPAHADLEIAACSPRVLRDHPGSRATIAYLLEVPPGGAGRGWPGMVVAKTYAGDTGRQTDQAMRALWAAQLDSGAITIAEPLGYLPELRLLVQGPVAAERTLAGLLRAALAAGDAKAVDELDAAAEQAARALAALHTSTVEFGPLVTIDGEVASLARLADRLAGLVAELAGAAAPLLEWVQTLAARDQADAAVPTHRSFHPGQVLLGGRVGVGPVGVIDFDELCQAEPALDVAQFRATTRYLAVAVPRGAGGGGPVDQRPALTGLAGPIGAERVCAGFQRRYQTLAPVSPGRVGLWETLHLCTYLLHCWTSLRPHRLAATVALLNRQLRTLGAPR